MKFSSYPAGLFWLLCWGSLALAALFLRPLWPVDETRYVAVAWEMWQRGDFLVPYLHGAPYSHKPPLLFWLMHAGWAVFGVNEWWPRLLAPLLSLFCAWLMLRLARRLWPTEPRIASHAQWIYAGSLLFGVLFTLVGFDFPLTASVLISMLGLARAAQGDVGRGMLVLGLGIALGVLSKGPVILLHVLPVAVLAPWWAPQWRVQKLRWYRALLGAVLLGAVLALLWAVPAAYVGGAEYRQAIFWGQTAGRMTQSFAHRAPFWWYLPLLPLLLFPWLWWPPLWRGWRMRAVDQSTQNAQRFLIAWLLPVLLGFSLISGKQVRYLLPLLPAFALLAAQALYRVQQAPRRFDMLWPATGFALAAGGLWYAAQMPQRFEVPATLSALPQWPAWALGALAAGLLLLSRQSWEKQMRTLALAGWGVMLILYIAFIPLLAPYSDPRPVAQHLSGLQRQGIALAHWQKYHGQFNFVGRLQKVPVLLTEAELSAWLQKNPQGRILVTDAIAPARGYLPEYERTYRSGKVQVWRGSDFAAIRQR